ncbi:hypothetical protein QN277_018499 [Acacia crassicarpa]|uniref:Peptidase A1 domain-containing protein n=1 Tax=Acacia crassicarpa TaxID=499986 RepID=A0AAE1JQN7_9FABA|nr:hypothetical protein QN277_018499 [Acacia crassicarpa]
MASSSSIPLQFAFLSVVCFLFLFIENKPFVSAITRKGYNELPPTHYHHHVPLSSLFPSSTCGYPPKGRSRKGSLEVVHKHGPCSKPKQHASSSLIIPHSEILEQDIARVRAIQSKLRERQSQAREESGRPKTFEASGQQAATLPARSGEILGSAGNYYVTVGLGTPARELSLVFDTGSDLTWAQCLPCDSSASCYSQNEPIFYPKQSSSYSDIPCSSSQCSLLSSATGIEQKCSASGKDCIYGITYGDNSFSTGNFAKETLTVTPTHVVDGFLFGCGHDNEGLFKGTAGLLGLGRSHVSFVQQTSDTFNKTFSYCLPSTASDVGYLTFGGVADSGNIIYTPLTSIPQASSLYSIDLTGISLAGASLSIPSTAFSSGVIIDSGTVITRLPPSAYGPLRDAFRNALSRYPMVGAVDLLDTCYDLSGHKNAVVPKVTLSFGGGANVDLDASGVVYVVSETQVCLAFAANQDEREIAIIGNVQQRTMEVVYDVDGGKIGFRPHSCSGSSKLFVGVANMLQNYFIYFFTFYAFFKF